MADTDRDIDRALLLLRNKIRERGFTQLEVQESLSWGRSYISQLLTKQKSLRLEQLLKILAVLEVEPSEFFSELFPGSRHGFGNHPYGAIRRRNGERGSGLEDAATPEAGSEISRSVRELRSLVRGLVNLLVDRRLVGRDEIEAVMETSDDD